MFSKLAKKKVTVWVTVGQNRQKTANRQKEASDGSHATTETCEDREKEAPPGFEPGMADLQSAALAAWLRGLGRQLAAE